jgi:predicted  nucleic acid-binding Zn-ribbon protein
MRTRHKIPTIFNLSMVDVLCCALGCVIFLWLVNFREAKRRAAAAGETSIVLDATRSRLDGALHEMEVYRQRLAAIQGRLQETGQERDLARGQAAALTKEQHQLRDDLAAARSRVADLSKDAAGRKAELTALADRLQKKTQDYLTLVKDRDAAMKMLEAQRLLGQEKDKLFQAASRAADDVAGLLRESEARSRQLADEMPKLRDEVKSYREKLTAAEGKLTTLEQSLGEQKVLTERAVQARLAAENRFAGMALTGRRVVFLVDVSGSMDFIDEKTQSAQKWPSVRQTLLHLMRSLPELEKFQVILFSDKAAYLLGSDERWLSWDSKTSPARVGEALAAIKPKGNTNIYTAFEAAFRFRTDGLDTIYLVSDGLPNIGPGLTAEQARTLKEFERSEILSQHVRKTLKTLWNRQEADRPRVRINAVGFFYESPDVGAFLWALTRENDGSFVGMSKP